MNQLVRTMDDKVAELQTISAKLPQISLPVTHHFANGMFARECFIPAGTLFVGKRHKQEHFFMMLKGFAFVTSDSGVIQMRAPYVMVSKPGTKRAGYAVEDTVFVAVHRTDLTDIEAIREEVTETHPDDLFDAYNQVKPEVLKYFGGI